MRLPGIEATEIPASSAAKTASESAAKSTTPAKTSAAKQPALAAQQSLRARRLNRVADAVHVHPRHRAHLARLPADGYRLVAEVRVPRHRRKRRSSARCRGPRLRLRIRAQCAHQAQALRSVPRQLSNGL